MARIDNIINANSSYSKSVSGTSLQKATLNIWIYSGVQGDSATQGVNLGASGDRLATPTYTLSSSAVSYNGSNIVSFDIAPLVKDYLDPSTSDIYSGNNSVWVDIQITSQSGNITAIAESEHYLGQDGYDYSMDEQDSSTSVSRISNSDILTLEDSVYKLPINTSLNPTITFYQDEVETSTQTLVSSEQSNEQIQYIDIDSDTTSLVVEGFGSNLIVNGDDFSQSEWVAFDVTNSPNSVTSPDGTLNGATITALSGSNRVLQQLVTVSADPLEDRIFKGSMYVKSSSVTSCSLRVGGSTNNTPITISSEWKEFEAQYTLGATFTFVRLGIVLDNEGDEVDIAFGQVEEIKSSETINITKVCQGKYQPTKLTFVNKIGAFQDVWFFANSKQSLDVKSKNWNRRNVIGSSSITRATNVRNVTSIKQSITLNSGFYPENNNVVFEQLMQSNNVWMTQEGQTLPIVIKDTKFNFKDSVTDKMINYTLSVEYAFNKTRSL